MAIFKKPSAELVYDLINAANPDLVADGLAVSAANCKLGTPSATTVSGRPDINTKMTLRAVPNSDFIGKRDINYARLSLASLFRGVQVRIDRYSPTQTSATSVVFTIHQLLPVINSKYGMSLTTDDVSDGNILRGNVQENGFYTTTVNVVTKATSVAFTGTISLKWSSAPQDIATMITVNDLPGRTFPGGNDFSGAHALILSAVSYGIDFTDLAFANKTSAYPNGLTNNSLINAFINAAIGEINTVHSLSLPTDRTWYGQAGAIVVTLPSAQYPECNSAFFTHCQIVTPGTNAGDFGVGSFYFHYNAI